MQRLLTTLALVLLCIAATSAAYYYGRYLPRLQDAELADQRRKTDLENSQRCRADGLKFFADYRNGISSWSQLRGPRYTWFDPKIPGRVWQDVEMHFSRKLNTCLVEIGFSDTTGKDLITGYMAVVDIYSDRETISYNYVFVDGERKPIPGLPNAGGIHGSEEYITQKDKLFSQ